MCFLGSGNDLGRVLCWGAGYSGEDPYSILISVDEANNVLMDRWTILLDAQEAIESSENGVLEPEPPKVLFLYFPPFKKREWNFKLINFMEQANKNCARCQFWLLHSIIAHSPPCFITSWVFLIQNLKLFWTHISVGSMQWFLNCGSVGNQAGEPRNP